MAHGADKKREVRKAYVFARQSAPMIAATLGVSEGTIRRWKREAREAGDDWDRARAANTLAGEGLDALVAQVVEDFVVLYQATIDDVKEEEGLKAEDRVKLLASLADAFNKTLASAGKASPKLSALGIANDVLRRLGEFVARRYPQHGAAILEILEPFAAELAEALA